MPTATKGTAQPDPSLPRVRAPGADAQTDALPAGLIVGLLLALVLIWQWPGEALPRPAQGWFPTSLHTLTEFAAIVAALLVFSVAWHASSPGQPGNIVVIGCGFLAVGLIDMGHTLSYKGMPVFVTPSGVEKSVQFWLMARYAAGVTLLAAAMLPVRPLASAWVRRGLLASALLFTLAVFGVNLWFPQVWPHTFVDGHGLTAFKVACEYGVIALAGGSAWFFYRSMDQAQASYSPSDLCAASLITILSELCFTLYANVNDVFSLLGHLYKIVAYFFIYRAVFITSVREPYLRLKQEVQERGEAEKQVAFLAYHDVLTKLPNRALARDRLTQAMADAKRHDTLVALVFFDLDHFKTINDSLGHACGDHLLQSVATCLKAHVREADTVSRQGGDEFLLILKDLPDSDTVGPIIEQMLAKLSEPIVVDGRTLSTTASVGIAMYPHDGQDFETLLQRADTALYRAKEEGRNGYRFFDEGMNRELVERLTLRHDLRLALEQHQFVLHYQPQVDLVSGHVLGVEALIRWQHPQHGLLYPGKFIDVAEESGLIVPMGDWVIEEACRQAAQWDQQGLPPLSMAVNLSALQFKRGDVEEVVARSLAQSGLRGERLELELTESVLISDPDGVQRRLQRLKALGIKLAIDDFGTGYSSLSYLRRFSVDKLKIDQSFVRDLERQPEDVAIVRAIVQMAASLGLETIAEGVETLPMTQLLRSLGCQQAQGYWFARPMPPQDVAAWLDQAAQRDWPQAFLT